MVLTIASFAFSLVQVPPIPVSPSIYLPLLLAWNCRGEIRTLWGRIIRNGVLPLLGAVFLAQVITLFVLGVGSIPSFVGPSARLAATWLTLLALTAYASSSTDRFHRMTMAVLVLLGASCMWFLAEIVVGTPVVELRLQLYSDLYIPGSELSQAFRTGLAPFTHLLGYQIAGFVPLACAYLFWPRLSPRARLAGLAGMAIGVAALFLSLQRSSLAAAALGCSLVWALSSARALNAARIAGVLGLLAVGAVVAVTVNPVLGKLLQSANVVQKLLERDAHLDQDFRVALQERAVGLLVQHPFGLIADNVDWSHQAWWPTYRKVGGPREYTKPFAVHNSYLVGALNYGVGFLILTLVLLIAIAACAWRVFRRRQALAAGRLRTWSPAIVGGVLGLATFPALTHNASVITREPATLLLVALLVALDLHLDVQRKPGLDAAPAAV